MREYTVELLATSKKRFSIIAESAEEAVGKVLDNTVTEEQKHIPTGGFISDLRMIVNSKSSHDCATFQALLESPNNAKNFEISSPSFIYIEYLFFVFIFLEFKLLLLLLLTIL